MAGRKFWLMQASLVMVLLACSANESFTTVQVPSKFNETELEALVEGVEPLAYDILKIEEVGYEDVIRKEVSVAIPENYSALGILGIAPDVVEQITQEQSVNAIFIYFYPSDIEPDPLFDAAFVVWAPDGRWTLADRIQTGDYSQHLYLLGDYESPTEDSPDS